MKYLVLLVSVLVLFSCKQENTHGDQVVQEVVEIPEDFVEFYQKFHSDSLFQLAHVVFPLKGKSDTTQWIKESWLMHHPIDNSSGEFNRTLDNFQNIIIETITHDKGLFHMIRRFAKLGDEWNLIFYNVKTISFSDEEQ